MAVGSVGGILPDHLSVPEEVERDQPTEREEVLEEQKAEETEEVKAASGDVQQEESTSKAIVPAVPDPRKEMWDEWGQRVEVWSSVKEIADRAVGSVVASLSESTPSQPLGIGFSLEPTPVPWSAVENAWTSHRNSRKTRREWVEESGAKAGEEKEVEKEEAKEEVPVDEVIERIKRDNTLDPHEQRLLGCIVDPGLWIFTFFVIFFFNRNHF